MRKMSPAVLLALCALAAGCAVPATLTGYLENRRQDLIDVLHVDLGLVNAGAVVYALPFMVGIDYQTGTATRTESDTLQIGLGGPRVLGRKGTAAGILFPSSKWDEDKPLIGKRPKRAPSGFSAGASVGAFLGVGVEADVLELVDFIVGFTCIDILEDDENTGSGLGQVAALLINVGATGVTLAGKALTMDDLRAQLLAAAKRSPASPVTIASSAAVPYTDVLAIVQACQAAGLTNVLVSIAP